MSIQTSRSWKEMGVRFEQSKSLGAVVIAVIKVPLPLSLRFVGKARTKDGRRQSEHEVSGHKREAGDG